MIFNKSIITICVSILFLFGQEKNIPFHPEIKTGKLKNGLTYYVLQNDKPDNRAELRLAIKIGSVDEDEDQLGVAHFVEHMCFNGTRMYPKNELIDYLESIGTAFGPDLNAYTSFDETVYMLTIPTDDTLKFKSGVEILSEWAGFVTLDYEEIDKERGVVLDEWRRRRGAGARILDEQLPVIFGESKYSNRLPIGKPEIIENISYERIRDFYRKWYVPENMAFIAVGDFDEDNLIQLIHQYFNRLPDREESKPAIYDIPNHSEKRIIISSDPEATRTMVSINWKLDPVSIITINDLKRQLLKDLYIGMLNERLKEKVKEKESMLVTANSRSGKWVETKEFTSIRFTCDEDNIYNALKETLRILSSVKKLGFIESELIRFKSDYEARLKRQYNNRNKTESNRLVWNIVHHYLNNESLAGIEWEYEVITGLLKKLTIQDINNISFEIFPEENIVIQISLPENNDNIIPQEEDILDMFNKAELEDPELYTDNFKNSPLLNTNSINGKIIKEKYYPTINTYKWQCSNGATIIAKPTDFKEDEILFKAFAPGGNSITPKNDYFNGILSTSIISESGVGDFDAIQLDKKLSGKLLQYKSFIGEYYHGSRGNTTNEDLNTFFKILYLNWTDPNYNPDAFYNLMEKYKVYVENIKNSPEIKWRELLNRINYSNHYSIQPLSKEIINNVNLDRSLYIYRDRFANPGNFTFVFIGDFEIDLLKKYTEKFIGGLPILSREQSEIKNLRYHFPLIPKKEELKMGKEPKSRTTITFYKSSKKDLNHLYFLDTACEILQVRLRKLLREEMGSTYSVRVGYNTRQPATSFTETYISYSNSPENTDLMQEAIWKEIKKLKIDGPDNFEVQNIIKKNLKKREVDLENNRFWINNIESSMKYDADIRNILKGEQIIKSVTPEIIKKIIKKHFSKFRYSIVTLNPEE